MEHPHFDPIDEALTCLEEADAHRRAAEVDKVRALLALADAWEVDESSAEVVAVGMDMPKHLRAMERRLEGGADGTTQVGEFLALEVGPVLGITPTAAAGLIADALNLRDRHPALWQAVQDRHLDVWQARRVTRTTSHLPHPAALWVDRQLALTARLMPWPRVLGQLAGLIVKAEPALAAERARRASAARYVRFGPIVDGHIDLWARLDAGDALALNATLNHTADTLVHASKDACAADPVEPLLKDAEPLLKDEARAIALGLLARGHTTEPHAEQAAIPGSTRPHATLLVHVSDVSLARGDGVARIEGWGPELVERLPRLLAGSKVTVRLIIDPATLTAADSYEIPERLRWAICVRNPVDTFPYGNRTATACDLDHTIAYPAGPTSPDNLAPLSRRPHRAKTHGLWHVRQTEPGHLEWTSPHQRRYLVTPTGTRRLPKRETTPTTGPDRAKQAIARRERADAPPPHAPPPHAPPPDNIRHLADYATPRPGITIDATALRRRAN